MAARRSGIQNGLEQVSTLATHWTGSGSAFALAAGVVVVWAALGPVFDYSNTWQLVINTGTTIVTFLMVFLIQRAQNKDSLAIQLKLNEIVAAIPGASNRLIDIEDMNEADLVRLHEFYWRLAAMAKQEVDLRKSHSIEEAEARHEHKHKHARPLPPG